MKNLFTFFLTLVLVVILFAYEGNAQVTVNGSTGADGPYTTLGSAFVAINGSPQFGDMISVTITANTIEPAPAILLPGLSGQKQWACQPGFRFIWKTK